IGAKAVAPKSSRLHHNSRQFRDKGAKSTYIYSSVPHSVTVAEWSFRLPISLVRRAALPRGWRITSNARSNWKWPRRFLARSQRSVISWPRPALVLAKVSRILYRQFWRRLKEKPSERAPKRQNPATNPPHR